MVKFIWNLAEFDQKPQKFLYSTRQKDLHNSNNCTKSRLENRFQFSGDDCTFPLNFSLCVFDSQRLFNRWSSAVANRVPQCSGQTRKPVSDRHTGTRRSLRCNRQPVVNENILATVLYFYQKEGRLNRWGSDVAWPDRQSDVNETAEKRTGTRGRHRRCVFPRPEGNAQKWTQWPHHCRKEEKFNRQNFGIGQAEYSGSRSNPISTLPEFGLNCTGFRIVQVLMRCRDGQCVLIVPLCGVLKQANSKNTGITGLCCFQPSWTWISHCLEWSLHPGPSLESVQSRPATFSGGCVRGGHWGLLTPGSKSKHQFGTNADSAVTNVHHKLLTQGGSDGY